MLRAGPQFTLQPAVLCGREGTGRGRLEEEGHPRKPGPSLHGQVHRQLPGPHINSTLDVRLDDQQAEAGTGVQRTWQAEGRTDTLEPAPWGRSRISHSAGPTARAGIGAFSTLCPCPLDQRPGRELAGHPQRLWSVFLPSPTGLEGPPTLATRPSPAAAAAPDWPAPVGVVGPRLLAQR